MINEKQTGISVTLQNLAFGSDGTADLTVPSGYVPACVLLDPNWFTTIHSRADYTYHVVAHKVDSLTTLITDFNFPNCIVICVKSS